MSLDRALIGRAMEDFLFHVEPFQLLLFAKAVGETRGIYTDRHEARRAGYRDLPALPTFPFSISTNPADPLDVVGFLGVELAKILHGEQAFEYFAPICAGDHIRVRRRIVDIFEKKGGALNFAVFDVAYHDVLDDQLRCRARQTLVVRA